MDIDQKSPINLTAEEISESKELVKILIDVKTNQTNSISFIELQESAERDTENCMA